MCLGGSLGEQSSGTKDRYFLSYIAFSHPGYNMGHTKRWGHNSPKSFEFIFYCCMKNYHKLNSLKQLVSSHSFCRSGVWAQLRWVLYFRISLGCNQGVSQAAFSSGGLTGIVSISNLIQIVGRTKSLVVLRLRPSVPLAHPQFFISGKFTT